MGLVESIEADSDMFESAFRHSATGMALVTLDGRWLQANGALCALLGYPGSELLCRHAQSIAHPDDVDGDAALIAKLAGGDVRSCRVEKRLLHSDGRVVWVLLTMSLVPAAGERPSFFLAEFQDISASQEAESQAHMFFEHSSDMLVIIGSAGRLERVNPAWESTLGWALGELTGRPFLELVHSDDRAATEAEVRAVAEGRRTSHFRNRYLSQDGYQRWIEWNIRPMPDGRMFGVGRDVTPQVAQDEELRIQAAVMWAVLDSMSDGVIVADPDGFLGIYNRAASQLLRDKANAAAPGGVGAAHGLFRDDGVTPYRAEDLPLARALRGESVDAVEILVRPATGAPRWHSVTANQVRDVDGALIGAVSVSRDVTARKDLEEQIRTSALTDDLTGLLNRRGFMMIGEQQLASAARYGRPMMLLFADLDGLKVINDQLGHEQGDRALADAAAILRATFRRSDVVARLGGDEFVVLGEGDAAFASTMTRRLLEAVAADEGSPERPYRLSMSVGTTGCGHEAGERCSLSELLSRADQAMYRVKRARRSARERVLAHPPPRSTRAAK